MIIDLGSIVWDELCGYSNNDELRPADAAKHAMRIAKRHAVGRLRLAIGVPATITINVDE